MPTKPKLLSGGNPQISKGDGDAPVQAYLNAMPGWKRGAGRRIDALVTRAVSLRPLPPGESSHAKVRHLDIREDDAIDAPQLTRWLKQASRLPGWGDTPDWRAETLDKVRALIKQADPKAVEEKKWRGVPVWSHDGIICTGETYKNVVKLTFAKGASLKDPARRFNSSLEGNTRRAIDIRRGEKIDAKALKALVRAAVALNAKKA